MQHVEIIGDTSEIPVKKLPNVQKNLIFLQYLTPLLTPSFSLLPSLIYIFYSHILYTLLFYGYSLSYLHMTYEGFIIATTASVSRVHKLSIILNYIPARILGFYHSTSINIHLKSQEHGCTFGAIRSTLISFK
ncbi:hypothetical protein FKM82_006274 [Ascaphus truei]